MSVSRLVIELKFLFMNVPKIQMPLFNSLLTAQDHKKLPNALCSFWGKIALGPVARNWEYKAVQ